MSDNFTLSCCSTVDVPYQYLESRRIPVLFYTYVVEDVTYVDDMGRDPQALPRFYEMLAAGKLPQTSQINVAEYVEFFDGLLKQGGDVLHLGFTSGQSGSIHNAFLAAEMLREKYPRQKLLVVDTLCSSSGYGLLVDTVADMRDAGATIDEAYQWAMDNRNKVHHQFFSTDMTQFRRTGRVSGAAAATVIAQYAAGLGLTIYALLRCRHMLPRRADFRFDRHILRELMDLSLLTCAQQSAMNFGILLIQRLVDSFGPVVMAAFAAAVKIDAFAYLPVQEFGNAFSTFSAQNYGAGQSDRLRQGLRQATAVSAAFSCAVAALVVVFARPLMGLFVQAGDTEVIACGVRYLRIEGTFYAGIGCLFLLYGFYRAVQRPGMSVVLTVVSLGTRVALAYALAGPVGEVGIWVAIPIGWFLADAAGYGYYLRHRKALLTPRAQ